MTAKHWRNKGGCGIVPLNGLGLGFLLYGAVGSFLQNTVAPSGALCALALALKTATSTASARPLTCGPPRLAALFFWSPHSCLTFPSDFLFQVALPLHLLCGCIIFFNRPMGGHGTCWPARHALARRAMGKSRGPPCVPKLAQKSYSDVFCAI